MRIELAGSEILLDASGALFLPRARTLVVADLHFEKGRAMARRGLLLPPYDTHATLARLEALIERFAPSSVVSLGDGFHDVHAARALEGALLDRLAGLVARVRWLWITGNHDPVLPLHLGGVALAEVALDGIVLRHVPLGGGAPEIAGHLHPKGRVMGRASRLTRPCFAVDARRVLMPAFGTFTGGLNVLHEEIRSLFSRRFDACLLGEHKVHKVPSTHLLPDPDPLAHPLRETF